MCVVIIQSVEGLIEYKAERKIHSACLIEPEHRSSPTIGWDLLYTIGSLGSQAFEHQLELHCQLSRISSLTNSMSQ